MGMIRYKLFDGVCVLRLDAPPLNTIGFALLEELGAAIRRTNSDTCVRGIVITGDADHFSAGADVGIFKQIASAEDAVRTSRIFQDAFQQIEDSPKPVAAAVAGRVMGSALELAAACHLRASTNTASFSMPEVNLGINPGAGGTQRLPRLLGPEAAFKMLLRAETLSAEQALQLGLVDAVCQPDQLLETAERLLRSAATPQRTGRRAERVRDGRANAAAFAKAEELLADVRAEIIAPRKIVEAVKSGLEESLQKGLLAEQQGFAQCMDTLATRNKIHLFFATRQTAKLPKLAGAEVVEAAEIAKAAVVGMGSMGVGIAQALIAAGVPVCVRDTDDATLQKGMDRIRSSVQKRIGQGKLSPERAEEMLGLISTTTNHEDLAGADLVIEAVFEDVPTKRSVIGEIEDSCAARTIIASNTSTISLDVLAEGMRHPERLIGMHFFNPAQRMPLVEIIRRVVTPQGVLASALKFAKTIRKTPLVVRNREGFLVNRLFIPYLKEAFWLLEDGADAQDVDAAMVEFGFAMGPLAVIDMAGLDILVSTDAVLSRAFPRHGCLSQIAVRLAEEGHLGQKTGAGVYRYEKGDYTPHRSVTTAQIIAGVQQAGGRAPRKIENHEITRRLVLRMVNEAFYVMEEEIAQRPSDVDVAMVLGVGFPDFRGGPLKYARDLGIDCVLRQIEELAERFGQRFSPCKLLRDTKGPS